MLTSNASHRPTKPTSAALSGRHMSDPWMTVVRNPWTTDDAVARRVEGGIKPARSAGIIPGSTGVGVGVSTSGVGADVTVSGARVGSTISEVGGAAGVWGMRLGTIGWGIEVGVSTSRAGVGAVGTPISGATVGADVTVRRGVDTTI
jgi:hypothetical protein